MALNHRRLFPFLAVFLAIPVLIVCVGAPANTSRLAYKSSDPGVVWAQDKLSQRVMLCNQTSRALEISHFATSCGCTSVIPSNITILPYGSAPVDILINTSEGHPFDIDTLAYKSLSIRPKLADGTYLETYTLSTAIRSPFTVDVRKLRFEQPLITGHRSENLAINLTLCPDIATLEAMNVDPRISVLCGQLNKTTAELAVTFNGNSPPGQLSASVGIRPTTNNGERLPPLSLHVIGNVVPDLVLDPEVIYVKATGLQSSRASEDTGTIRFAVASRSGAPVRGLQIRTNSMPQCLEKPVITGLDTSKVRVQANLHKNRADPASVIVSVEAKVDGQKINPNLELPVISL